jgi:hypothetical protein
MPLQASGRIKMSELATKFGGSGSNKLSEYYRGGSQVRSTGLNTTQGVPTSGKITIKDFYGTGNPILSVLNNGNYYSAYGATVDLTSASRGSNTSLILAYVANSAGQGSNITFTMTGHTVTQIVQRLNNVSDDGAACGVFSSNVGDVASVAVGSSGGVSGKNFLAFQYDDTPSMTSANDIFSNVYQKTLDLNLGENSFSIVAWANAFADDYNPSTFGTITSTAGSVTQNNAAVKTVGYKERFGSAGNFGFTVGGNVRSSRTGSRPAPRAQIGASFNL